MRSILAFAPAVVSLLVTSVAAAQDPVPPPQPTPDTASSSSEARPKDVEPKAPTAVSPWQLRGLSTGTSLRLDSTVAPYTSATTNLGYVETVSLFSASVQVAKEFAIQSKIGVVHSDPDSTGTAAGSGITNATVGGFYGTRLGSFFRFGAGAAVGLPIGQGSGNNPDPAVASAMKAAALARSGFDNTMFSVNEVGFPFGADLAYVRGRLTAQIEMNVIPSVRVQGELKSPDAQKVNSTAGIFLGYFLVANRLSVGAELRNQLYLSDPVAVQKDSTQRDSLSAAGGLRAYFPITANVMIKPGFSYGRGVYGAIADAHYQMVAFDLPVTF